MNVDSHGSIALDEVKYVAADATLRVQHGDVLFNNTNSPAWVGKSAAILRPTDWAFSNHMTRLRPSTGVDARFLAAQLQYLQQSGYFRHLCVNHVNQASISSGVIGDAVPVLLAPEREQIRIADRIDELFTDLAAGVAALERVKRNLSRYRAAVLHAAVTGRLTETWRKQNGPPDEPGPRLLERILVERRRQWERRTLAKYEKVGKQPPKNWKSKYKEPAPPKPSADGSPLPALPEGWCWASVDKLIWQSSYGTSVRCDYGAPGESVLRIPNIAKGELDLDDIKNATASLGIDDEGEYLAPGDLLVCRTNGSIRLIGKAALVRAAFDQSTYFASYLIRLRAIDLALATHLHLTFTSAHGRAFIEANAASSAGQHNVSMTTLQQMPVAVPPAAEQSAIVEAVNETLSQIDGLEAEVDRGLARTARLRQAILKAAFEGRLVPQDPKDEPASVLLEHIRAEAAAAESKPKPKARSMKSQKAATR